MPKPTEIQPIRLIVLGDVMLGRFVNERLKHEQPEFPWGDTLALLLDADYRICNLECVIADQGRPWTHTPKVFHFRSDAKNIAVLKAAKIDLLSLANNHVLDFDVDGMSQMLRLLSESGIGHCGAGFNRALAGQAFRWKIGETKFAMCALTDNEPGWQAQQNRPGVNYLPIETSLEKQGEFLNGIKRLRKRVDVLIVSAHWGGNWGQSPPAEHVDFAHRLIDHGADVVYGHSAHITRAIEFHRGRPILYSVGDFVDDYAVDQRERNDQGFVFTIEIFRLDLFRVRLTPIVIRDCQAHLAIGAEREVIMERMHHMCIENGCRVVVDPTGTSLLVSSLDTDQR